MYPIIYIHNYPIATWALFSALGFLIAFGVFSSHQKTPNFSNLIFFLSGTLVIYVFSRLFSFVVDPDFSHLDSSNFHGPMMLYGTIVGIEISIWLHWWTQGKPPALVSFNLRNAIYPAWLLGIAIGRIGCFLNGDDYGIPFEPQSTFLKTNFYFLFEHAHGINRFPVQLAEGFICFLGFLASLNFWKKLEFPLWKIIILWYGFFRFFLEFLRDDPRGMFGFFSMSQIISLLLFGIVFSSLFKVKTTCQNSYL